MNHTVYIVNGYWMNSQWEGSIGLIESLRLSTLDAVYKAKYLF